MPRLEATARAGFWPTAPHVAAAIARHLAGSWANRSATWR